MAPAAAVSGGGLPFPRRAVRVDPANLGTADCPAICACDDSCEYAIKDRHTNPLVPHAEWFCTHLGDLAGIACPDCQIIEMPDGSTVFGSRWEGGVLANVPNFPPTWVAQVQQGNIPLADLRAALTRIYAFDHFIHNTDRHAGNFLVREQRPGSYGLLAFDYSRAWIFNGFPLPPLPFPANNTINARRQLSLIFGSNYIDPDIADQFLDRLRQIPLAAVERIIAGHPQNWLPDTMRQAIINWWQSNERVSRIDGISMGIRNGTYL